MTWTGNSPNRIRGRRWMAIRAQVLKEEPVCRHCRRAGTITKDSISRFVDHIVPLSEGGKDERSNYQALCDAHHRSKTGEEAARARGHAAPKPKGCDETGWPIDPDHPWNATRPGAGISSTRIEQPGKPVLLNGINANTKTGASS